VAIDIITDVKGNSELSWKVPSNTIPGIFLIAVKISAEGYAEAHGVMQFRAI
jgi:hypothetical protein